VLTVEGTYTSGDREGITVSHEIDFGTMQIKRNYLYKVRIALEDPAGDTYGKVTHAINVKDWTSGVTLAWAGDENLYNNLAAANFTVTGTERKIWDADGVKLEQHLVLPYNAEKSATFYVTSTSTKSGLSLTCPATAVAATEGGYQCVITPQDNTYNENGEFTQKWQVTIRESALFSGAVLTFTLQNALNSALSTSFEVIGAPYASYTDIQAGDVYYANGYWSRPADKNKCEEYGATAATGVIAPVAAKETGDTDLTSAYVVKPYSGIALGDIYYSAGFWSPGTSAAVTACKAVSAPVALVYSITPTTTDAGLGFHAYAMALKDATRSCKWSTELTSIGVFSPTAYTNGDVSATVASFNADRDGYTKMLAVMEISDWATKFPAFAAARNYSAATPAGGCSGWFLPTTGQMKDFYLNMGGWTDAQWTTANLNGLYKSASYKPVSDGFKDKLNNAGLVVGTDYEYFFNENTTSPSSHRAYWLASENNASYAFSLALQNGDSNSHFSPMNTGYANTPWKSTKTDSWWVRSILAF